MDAGWDVPTMVHSFHMGKVSSWQQHAKFDVLFDKLGWWNEIVEIISNENQIKLERVYVRMPRH